MASVAESLDSLSLGKARLAYDYINERISDGTFAPGHRLVLGSIASQIGVSTVPVREAVRMLEAEGVVTFERNVGAKVTLVNAADYVNTMESLGIIEGAATALSARLLDEATLARAAAINERMEALLDHFDPHTFTILNQQFHATLFEVCPNAHLVELVQRDWVRLAGLRDSTFAFVPGRARHSVAEHGEILRLIRTGADPREIEEAARAHRWHTLQAYREARGLTPQN